MKITVTFKEVSDLILSQYNLPVNTVIEIINLPMPQNDFIKDSQEMFRLMDEVGLVSASGLAIKTDKKIEAIKRLREHIPGCGLANAKYAIENWIPFLDYVRAHGVPSMKDGAPCVWINI